MYLTVVVLEVKVCRCRWQTVYLYVSQSSILVCCNVLLQVSEHVRGGDHHEV